MAVRPPSLRSIAAFEAAARHSSFTKAAEELNLTPGAISHAIRSLEERLGQQLFIRSPRAVRLTPAGQTLAARVRLSLRLLTDAFDAAPWRALDRLVISTTHAIAQKVLLPQLTLLQDACAGARLDLRCSDAVSTFDDGIDVAVRFGPGGWRGLQSRLLAREELLPVASPEYAGGAHPQTQAELAGHVLIHHPESSWRLWLDPDERDPTVDAKAIHVDSAALVIEMAAAGHAIGLARARLAAGDIASGRLVRLSKRAVPAEYSYWAVWDGSSPKLSLIQAFVDAVMPLFEDELSSTKV